MSLIGTAFRRVWTSVQTLWALGAKLKPIPRFAGLVRMKCPIFLSRAPSPHPSPPSRGRGEGDGAAPQGPFFPHTVAGRA